MSEPEIASARLVGTFFEASNIPREKKHVIFLGRSNSGKSTLLSKLIHNTSLVKTSSKAGSTRSINVYDRGNVYLTDLPGYGFAQVSKKERERLSALIATMLSTPGLVTAGFLTIDCRRKVKVEEEYLLSLFREQHIPLNMVFTKIDKLNQKELARARKEHASLEKQCHNLIYFSALKLNQREFIYRYIASL